MRIAKNGNQGRTNKRSENRIRLVQKQKPKNQKTGKNEENDQKT